MTGKTLSFTHYDLKEQLAGTQIEVTLSAVANVRLMNTYHFTAYKEALKHQFIGGVAKKSPIVITIPQTGDWHLVVDGEGHGGLAKSSIKLVDRTPRFNVAQAAKG
ncbi:DUF1883 domain-containing protein [Pararhizobium sp.]|uniref:DUF1883 domain-containing protein n=1 Tax=Pararhizobium sp. TaxID=1977563 RepID=UPI00271A9004|nr:DUF1883 domain-containing protein [Pararhizobium sp.]MDO9416935.1 DUF1883 domain-containing protein [Pararhizobium sp.]